MNDFPVAPSMYAQAHAFLQAYAETVASEQRSMCLWLTEHQHVYTAGTSAKDNHLLNAHDIPVIKTGRGGDYTYHGPGQRMIYPFIKLNDYGLGAREYMHTLEQIIINTLCDFGVSAHRLQKFPGVWCGTQKIAAVGVRIRRGIAFHGAALNVNTNLHYFNGIVPCGIADYGVTSLQQQGVLVSYCNLDLLLHKKMQTYFANLPLIVS